jgi:Sulfatase
LNLTLRGTADDVVLCIGTGAAEQCAAHPNASVNAPPVTGTMDMIIDGERIVFGSLELGVDHYNPDVNDDRFVTPEGEILPVTSTEQDGLPWYAIRVPATSSNGPSRPTSRSSCGTTPLAVMSGLTSEKWKDKSGFGLYADAMMELDSLVGQLLDKLDELGIADNTIVLFTSDNGAEVFTLPDGGNHPFRGEKGTTYEGGFRVPMVARWPGVIEPGIIVNDIIASEDWVPALVAAAGDPDVKEKLLTGHRAGDGKTFKNHLDGYNFMPYFTGEVSEGPRHEFFYFTDNGDLTALRYNAWKVTFKTIEGNLFTGTPESTNVPLVTNLRADPWERYQTEAPMYSRWWGEKLFTLVPAAAIVGQFLQSFVEFPPSQASASFGVERALKALEEGGRKN